MLARNNLDVPSPNWLPIHEGDYELILVKDRSFDIAASYRAKNTVFHKPLDTG
jgi:hypothetical protein